MQPLQSGSSDCKEEEEREEEEGWAMPGAQQVNRNHMQGTTNSNLQMNRKHFNNSNISQQL